MTTTPLRTRARFTARWPITDDTRTPRELADEAIETLPALTAQHGAVLTGNPTWWIDTDTSGNPWLVFESKAWPALSNRRRTVEADNAASVGGSLVAFTPCRECDLPAGTSGLCESHRQARNRTARLARKEAA